MFSLCRRGIFLCRSFPETSERMFRVTSVNINKLTLSNSVPCTCHVAYQLPAERVSFWAQRGSFLSRFYRSTNSNRKSKEKKESRSAKDGDIEELLHDKSLGITAKFKLLFQQYGIVLVVVHCITAVFWFSLFYTSVSRGFDIVPIMEKYGVFDFLEKIGLPASEKLKNPGASNALAAYLLYEVAKPIRYPVTVIGTIYAVRFLRRLGHLKKPPKTDTTVMKMMETQSKIMHNKFKTTASKYRDRYKATRLKHPGKKLKQNGHRNGHKRR